jgi:mRNA-degrading endonuclease toxin of MazEF toxin-antitoxin module
MTIQVSSSVVRSRRRSKNYPFEVLIAGTPQNVVLADQVKSLDWRARKALRKGAVSFEELADVRAKMRVLTSDNKSTECPFTDLP